MDFTVFVKWAFEGLIVGIAGYGVHVLSKLQQNVAELNVQMAVVLEKMSHYNERILRLEKRDDE